MSNGSFFFRSVMDGKRWRVEVYKERSDGKRKVRVMAEDAFNRKFCIGSHVPGQAEWKPCFKRERSL